jgi:hypothetical protein
MLMHQAPLVLFVKSKFLSIGMDLRQVLGSVEGVDVVRSSWEMHKIGTYMGGVGRSTIAKLLLYLPGRWKLELTARRRRILSPAFIVNILVPLALGKAPELQRESGPSIVRPSRISTKGLLENLMVFDVSALANLRTYLYSN